MKQILLVTSGLGAGGAEKVISLLARHWARQGHKVSIATFDLETDQTYHTFPAGISLHRLGEEAPLLRRGRLSKIADLWALRTLIRRTRPEIVVSFLTKNNLIALAAAMGTATRVICCERNNPERQDAHWFWNAALTAAYRRAALIICQTEAVIRCMPPAAHGRILVIPNPISRWPVERDLQSPRTIVAVGRLETQKGFDILLDAFAAASGAAPEWRLEIWGEGPDQVELETRIRESGLGERAFLMGLSDEPGSWLLNAEIFVLPSRYEGFPNVLGEAMAAGLPVIATSCDFGPAEMICDNEDGILVEPENPTALAAAMARCMEDTQLRDRLGKAAARSITRFSPPKILSEWDRAIEELSATPNARRAHMASTTMSAAE